MARRISELNGDAPPPSTLAAQIVQNQTKPAVEQQNGNGEAAPFTQLLQELLNNPAAAQESDVGVNVKLISVVLEAGLAPLAQDNPFIPVEQLIPVAKASLAVIEGTVKRQPEVLLAPTSESGPQLALALLAQLFGLCGRTSCLELPIPVLIETAIRALSASPELWRSAGILHEVCRETVDDCINALNTKASSNSEGFTGLPLPPARSVAKLWPESEKAIALPYGCQSSITSEAQVYMLALMLTGLPSLPATCRDEAELRLQGLLVRLRKKLEKAKVWDQAVQCVLGREHNSIALRDLLHECPSSKLTDEAEEHLVSALLRLLRGNDFRAAETLLPELLAISFDECFPKLHEDLKIAATTLITRLAPEEELNEYVSELRDGLRDGNSMFDGTVFHELSIPPAITADAPRRRKRRRIGHDDNQPTSADLVKTLAKILDCNETSDLAGLMQHVPAEYPELDEAKQFSVWPILTKLAGMENGVTLPAISNLLKLPIMRQSKGPRVLALAAIKTAIQHTSDKEYLDLAVSQLGRTCLESLHSSVRELRIAAGYCLPAFLRADLPSGLTERNRHTALEYLRYISDRDVPSEHETLVGAWAQVGAICGDRELNLVLLRLAEYLGHPNSVVSGVAYNELERLAVARQQTADALFAPFWSTVAVTVVQDLHTRPQKAQLLCNLLHTDVDKLLVLTERHTVPALVLTKKKDILQRIATARGSGSVQQVILQPSANLAATVALLLTQPVNDPEEAALECLGQIAPDFRGMDLGHYVKMEPILTACEMLKLSGDAPDNRKSRLYRAIQLFASLAQRGPGQSKSHSKLNKAVLEYFDQHILGIMAHFSQIIEDVGQTHPSSEKVRSLKAVTDLLHLTKSHASIALPQLRACLQSAMKQAELCELAFFVWLELLSVLEPEDIGLMLAPTFALILRHWKHLSPEIHQRVHDSIGELFRNHNKIVQENLMSLPSLARIPLLSKYADDIDRLQMMETVETRCAAFAKRLRTESPIVIEQALRELVPFLTLNQDFVHNAAASDQPVAVLSALIRAVLDVTTAHSRGNTEIADLCGQALGVIGCLDPNRLEVTTEERRVLVLSNFEKASETVDWVTTLLEDVLVKAFKSVTNARAQGFLAFTMQELLRICSFTQETTLRTRATQGQPSMQDKWLKMPEHVRITLTPYLSSHYRVTNAQLHAPEKKYPGFSMEADHGTWMRGLVYDLLWKAKGDNPKMVFPLIGRLVRALDLSIAHFMLPYAVINIVLGGTVGEVKDILSEILAVLQAQPSNSAQVETVKQCAETVFRVLDYMSSWLQEKKKILSQTRADAYKTGLSPNDFDEATDMGQIEEVERFLNAIPAEAIATRAVECGSYARALFNWEHFIRQGRGIIPSPRMSQAEENMYDRLHSIYSCIDEPDGLEGIGSHLSFLTEEQQTVQHTKAGRWTAASAWYEVRLADAPADGAMQMGVLDCLRQTGQYAAQLRYAQAFAQGGSGAQARLELLPLIIEAQWMTGDLAALRTQFESLGEDVPSSNISVQIGKALAVVGAWSEDEMDDFYSRLSALRVSIAQSLTVPGTSSLQACHGDLLNLHALHEIGALSHYNEAVFISVMQAADKRLAALGAYNADKQYLLAVRRAAIKARPDRCVEEPGNFWLATARLARKAGHTHSAYNAVRQASAYGNREAKLEEARLLWHDGHRRQAINALEAAIVSGVFEPADEAVLDPTLSTVSNAGSRQHNVLMGKAHLLLTKWLDASGQTQVNDMTARYQYIAKNFQRWEKGHYYLGKHYNKLLDAQKVLPEKQQSQLFQSGEMAKLVVENLMRSIPFGNKYWHETIPKVLTLWLDLGVDALTRGKVDHAIFDRRQRSLQIVSKQFQKYYGRIPAYVFYTALPQMISRINHPHPDVWRELSGCIVKIVQHYPSQAMWYILPLSKASEKVRLDRGTEMLTRLRSGKGAVKTDGVDVKMLITQSQKLSEALLLACEQPVEQRRTRVDLRKDLHFNTKLAPIPLVVPVETSLIANTPTDANSDTIRRHKAFAQEKVTIAGFKDDVLVLSSLQRPKKITVRGSDGKEYGLLCKPKDDLRKDQRLMEFNGIINRALKRDAESSKRRLYIKTYAVTPLSEESGTLEWVEGIKPMRDILLTGYGRKGTRVDYGKIKDQLNKAVDNDDPSIFTNEVVPAFPPLLHEWFAETYSEPETWFAARLRYARSAAVMSMTGHVLGLGDRHGENILLEEGTGGVIHVDFNCLFDKGKTFEKPELVPFRLTHNMVDAMGPYGYEGPFRKSSELAMGLLRQNIDTLKTVLETFLYDPTTDFVGKKKRHTAGVPETPQEILDSVQGKLRGLLGGESVPLGVEGYVDYLVKEAVSPANLAGMYIGWCAFL